MRSPEPLRHRIVTVVLIRDFLWLKPIFFMEMCTASSVGSGELLADTDYKTLGYRTNEPAHGVK